MTRHSDRRPQGPARSRPVVVTGGAGFIGANLSDSLAGEGREVIVLDNLSRPGVSENLAWLRERHGSAITPAIADIRDGAAIADAVRGVDAVFHLAAQTAVTTSMADPLADFEVNAMGSLMVLEAVRAQRRRVPVIFASTNKVYGALADLAVGCEEGAWLPVDAPMRRFGVPETRPLDFRTPYGCSKGVADQYVLDYAASFGIPTAVLRMSCIYGPRQFGTEDQGWVAHFLLRTIASEPITIYGDGRQVRDILHVSDAVRAYRLAWANIDAISGRAFNLGGGPHNAVSLLMVLGEIARLAGTVPRILHADWRPGDQPWFVADTRAIGTALGWSARTPWREGLEDLANWVRRNRRPDGARSEFSIGDTVLVEEGYGAQGAAARGGA